MRASKSALTELLQLRDEYRKLDDYALIVAWKANEAALQQPNQADQARFRHYAFRMTALERFGFAEHAARCHRESEAGAPLLPA